MLNQDEIFHLGDFVNMNTTPYAWDRAFPTLFYPVYTYYKGKLQWTINGDITAHAGKKRSES